MRTLQDAHGRRFHYLRLSITEACNFRCSYCLPKGYRKDPVRQPELSLGEIRNLGAAFAELGVSKVRLTGGEPTLRRDLLDIVRTLAQTPGIDRVALSTNGYRLRALARPLFDAGVRALNVSMDSLDRKRFAAITGQDRLEDVRAGIEEAFEAGFDRIKVNAVLLKETNEEDLDLFLEWVRKVPVSVRFIELMETGENRDFFRRHHISAGRLQLRLNREGWRPRERGSADGPALEYRHPEFAGAVGLIAPYSKDFCASCNRLRVTSLGLLRLCLFGDRDFSLRPWLAEDSRRQELVETVLARLSQKAPGHFLHEGNFGNTAQLASIGG